MNLRIARALLGAVAVAAAGLSLAVWFSVQPMPDTLGVPGNADLPKLQALDRLGRPLSFTFASDWNVSDQRALHQVPASLQRAFVEAEDTRFYSHSGVDWLARGHAILQNSKAGRIVRGASTISEQVVRMLHPRRRTVWSRLIEGVEAWELERKFSKVAILEFYLNQVPFAGRRRGVVQAARHYFNRDLETLSEEERLMLAVLVRSPDRLDLYRDQNAARAGAVRLAAKMEFSGALSGEERASLDFSRPSTERPSLSVRADHFVRFVHAQRKGAAADGRVVTTVDASLQKKVQELLEARIADLAASNVTDGAVLVVENRSGEVLAWVNAGELGSALGSHFDGVLTPRQPGSTLKPFLYAQALERGWTAATIVDDSPLVEGVGSGLHNFRNYSRVYYGELPVREALGNSLNVPAVKTVQFVGKEDFLRFLRGAGFESLSKPASFYGEGLALGNGEVTLYELVRAYAALANRGVLRDLKVMRDEAQRSALHASRIVSPEVASIIGNILSDPRARRREFGAGGLLRFPVQTAVKTGTSTDYRDAWAVGFSDGYTVGVWLGNMNRASMREISGARGPALVLRSVFAELERGQEGSPLWLSSELEHRSVCLLTGHLAGAACPKTDEVFVAGTEPTRACPGLHAEPMHAEEALVESGDKPVRISMPTPGLNIARDPRIPDSSEAFPLEIESALPVREVCWIVDDAEVARRPGTNTRYLWPLKAGRHHVIAKVQTPTGETIDTNPIAFWVK